MIRWIYSNTLSRGMEKHFWSPKTTDVHFANAWVQAIAEHPEKEIEIRNIGLQYLEPKDFDVFNTADIVYTHLISIPSEKIGNKYKWHDFPQLIKEFCSPNPPMVMMAIDNEMGHVPPQPQIKRALDSADLIIAVTKLCLDEWKKYTKTPICYVPSPKYYYQMRDPVPYEDREKRAALIRHTWMIAGCNGLRTQLKVVAKAGIKCLVFNSWFNEKVDKIYRWADREGVKRENIEAHMRIKNRVEYATKLSKCFVGIEDEYIGASRFASECASLKIPVIGTEWITGVRVANPELVTPKLDVDKKVKLVKKLLDDPEFYRLCAEGAYERIRHHYDAGVCLDRLKKAWFDAGLAKFMERNKVAEDKM